MIANQKPQNTTTADPNWIEAVERADSDTLIAIHLQEEEKAEHYEVYVQFYRARIKAVRDELTKREALNV